MFARLALRLAACEALSPHAAGGAGPWPTLAGPHVYDSRIDPIANAETAEALEAAIAGLEDRPVIVVYTETDEARPFDEARVPVRDVVARLVIEIMIATRSTIEVTGPDGVSELIGAISAPVTDRQREALLDALEAQVRRLLTPSSGAPTALLYRKVAREVRSISSDPQRLPDRTLKMALRTLHIHVAVANDVFSADAEATGLDLLPEPLLTVARGLDPTSSAYAVCADLAALLAPAAPPLPLAGATLLTGVDRAPTPTDFDFKADLPA